MAQKNVCKQQSCQSLYVKGQTGNRSHLQQQQVTEAEAPLSNAKTSLRLGCRFSHQRQRLMSICVTHVLLFEKREDKRSLPSSAEQDGSLRFIPPCNLALLAKYFDIQPWPRAGVCRPAGFCLQASPDPLLTGSSFDQGGPRLSCSQNNSLIALEQLLYSSPCQRCWGDPFAV